MTTACMTGHVSGKSHSTINKVIIAALSFMALLNLSFPCCSHATQIVTPIGPDAVSEITSGETENSSGNSLDVTENNRKIKIRSVDLTSIIEGRDSNENNFHETVSDQLTSKIPSEHLNNIPARNVQTAKSTEHDSNNDGKAGHFSGVVSSAESIDSVNQSNKKRFLSFSAICVALFVFLNWRLLSRKNC